MANVEIILESLPIELANYCCHQLKYHWGALFHIHEGRAWIFAQDQDTGDWWPKVEIAYCPFCGARLDLSLSEVGD